ncbi:hypothetical protein FTX61_02445 [Nitriliruptoraceae bacterium ZYF776]|nr:hypothetical protein [Profundirhabdus halotolerans]
MGASGGRSRTTIVRGPTVDRGDGERPRPRDHDLGTTASRDRRAAAPVDARGDRRVPHDGTGPEGPVP